MAPILQAMRVTRFETPIHSHLRAVKCCLVISMNHSSWVYPLEMVFIELNGLIGASTSAKDWQDWLKMEKPATARVNPGRPTGSRAQLEHVCFKLEEMLILFVLLNNPFIFSKFYSSRFQCLPLGTQIWQCTRDFLLSAFLGDLPWKWFKRRIAGPPPPIFHGKIHGFL